MGVSVNSNNEVILSTRTSNSKNKHSNSNSLHDDNFEKLLEGNLPKKIWEMKIKPTKKT